MEPFTKEQLAEMPEAEIHKRLKELRDSGLNDTDPKIKQLLHEYRFRECMPMFERYGDLIYYFLMSDDGIYGEVVCKICLDHSLHDHENKVMLVDQFQTISITFYLAPKYHEVEGDLIKYIRSICNTRRLHFEF